MKNRVSNSILDGNNKEDFQLLHIKITNEQPKFSLKRGKQDNKNSDSASIRDEHCIPYMNIQVFSLLMEKTAPQIQTRCPNLYTLACTLTCTHTAYSGSKLVWGTEGRISDLQLFFLHNIKTHCSTPILTQSSLENQGHKKVNIYFVLF